VEQLAATGIDAKRSLLTFLFQNAESREVIADLKSCLATSPQIDATQTGKKKQFTVEGMDLSKT
jgi:hypothetical protein